MDLLCGGGHLRRFVIWIEQDLPLQERAENIEQPIGDTAQCPSMAVPAAAQLGIALAADRIMLDGPRGPNDRRRFAAACRRHGVAPRCSSCRCGGLPGPRPTRSSTRGNLAAAEARRPRRAAWRC